MDWLTRLWDNLKSLGNRKLAALALTFVLVVSVLGVGGYYLSRPNFEILYSGLDRDDVSRIGSVLKSAGIAFDITPDGNAVSVNYGQTAQARMLLAERGLPQSANAGYELFDKVGALGLTSFMQEVTRVRAIEGELSRTIQLIRGVKAARVHIVMPDEGSFRRAKQPPSASVVIRSEGPDDSGAAQAIRHLVAAALPGMTVDQVTVLNTDGMILTASDGDPTDAVPGKTLTLEKSVSKDIQDNIRKTLTPYLRLPNFQVSVRARINTDRRQVNETIYDPDSKVERSVRTVKENSMSQNASNTVATSVERNIPQEKAPAADGKQSNDENKKSEELTNFEVSTKTVTTVSGGYTIENIAIAVLVNRAAFGDQGKSPPKPDVVERQLKEIEQIVASTAGIRKERGDVLKVSAVDFTFNEHELSPMESAGFMEGLSHNLGTIINAATLLAITAAIVFFGLRPATRALLAETPIERLEGPQLLGVESNFNLAAPSETTEIPLVQELASFDDVPTFGRSSTRQQLEQLITADELQAALVLKQWMRAEDHS
jgi:flagellar M-ring protein FliF